jgi:hypothetical protein
MKKLFKYGLILLVLILFCAFFDIAGNAEPPKQPTRPQGGANTSSGGPSTANTGSPTAGQSSPSQGTSGTAEQQSIRQANLAAWNNLSQGYNGGSWTNAPVKERVDAAAQANVAAAAAIKPVGVQLEQPATAQAIGGTIDFMQKPQQMELSRVYGVTPGNQQQFKIEYNSQTKQWDLFKFNGGKWNPQSQLALPSDVVIANAFVDGQNRQEFLTGTYLTEANNLRMYSSGIIIQGSSPAQSQTPLPAAAPKSEPATQQPAGAEPLRPQPNPAGTPSGSPTQSPATTMPQRLSIKLPDDTIVKVRQENAAAVQEIIKDKTASNFSEGDKDKVMDIVKRDWATPAGPAVTPAGANPTFPRMGLDDARKMILDTSKPKGKAVGETIYNDKGELIGQVMRVPSDQTKWKLIDAAGKDVTTAGSLALPKNVQVRLIMENNGARQIFEIPMTRDQYRQSWLGGFSNCKDLVPLFKDGD